MRLASKYEEDLTGSTTIGFPTVSFSGSGDKARLGSGMIWTDDMSGPRELQANASRIDGFRGTEIYKALQIVSATLMSTVHLSHNTIRRTSNANTHPLQSTALIFSTRSCAFA